MKLPTKLPSIDLSGWRVWALALVTAGIVHICATFATIELAGQPAYERLARTLEPHRMQVLPAVTPTSQPLPYWSPEFRYALCRYRTSQGSVLVTASLPDNGWTLTVFSKSGESTYSVAGQAGRRTDIVLLLVPPGDRFITIAPEAVAGQGGAGAPLAIPARDGIVIVRAPDKGVSFRNETELELRKAQCSYRSQ